MPRGNGSPSIGGYLPCGMVVYGIFRPFSLSPCPPFLSPTTFVGGYSALFIESPSTGFAIMLGGLLAWSRVILLKCCVIRPFSMPFGYFFSTIWLFFSIISLLFPSKTAVCVGLSYTFPSILHAILHPKMPIIANNFQWWCRMCRRFPKILVGVCVCLNECL